MRYDNLLRSLERAQNRYESEVRRLLERAMRNDKETATRLIDSLKPTPKKKKKTYHKTARWFAAQRKRKRKETT